jgi:ATP-binding cassette subfamily B protein
MIERFYDPRSGDILFDSRNLKDISLASLRESIGYVSQEPVLILGSIRDNLLNACCNATVPEMELALKKASASFVE